MSAKGIIPAILTELNYGPTIPAALRRVAYGVCRAAKDHSELDGAQTIAAFRQTLDLLEQDIARGAYPMLLPAGDPIGERHRAYCQQQPRVWRANPQTQTTPLYGRGR